MKSLLLITSLWLFLGCFDLPQKDWQPKYEQHYKNNETITVDYARVPGHVPDATKDDGTNSMCWSMVTCNQLVYAGYIQDWETCVSNHLEEFGNKPNSLGKALGFYFTEYLAVQWSSPEVYTAAGNKTDDLTLSFLMNNIDEGRPVALAMQPTIGQKTGHVVLVFGYDLNFEGDEIDLYLVDGDDNKHTTWMTLTSRGDSWPITGGTYASRFKIDFALALITKEPGGKSVPQYLV